ncbi:helix-turn-helix transcriptional regulator [Halobacteriovorax sp. GB3]|uniref:helix-turn-helix domain-containing protein n=1 Tax=Halobacteriovorax sp. GB3 TaxID=2719615 RepID=UPI00235ECEF8|nr:helix-turn-helix transcriptional regulator [Halobacteriovorax sp. GB3]MDD0851847.1 helix-turn-helix transcriptional regulator [Halobacteriovorax sp. GB3]
MIQEEREAAKKAAGVIRCARKMNNLTQTDISEMLKISQGTVSKVESGDLILSSYHWMRFCEICGISMETIGTGYIEQFGYTQVTSNRRIGKFQLSARYANNAGMKVRDFLPLIDALKNNLGEKDWKSFSKKRFKIDEDYFINLDHQLSFYFVQDLIEEMINQHVEVSTEMIASSTSLEKLKKQISTLKSNPFDQIRFPDKYCRYLNGDFNLVPTDENEDRIHFKYIGKKHLNGFRVNQELANKYFQYKQQFFAQLLRPLNIDLLDSNGLEGSFVAHIAHS